MSLPLATSIGTRSLALSGTGAVVVDPEPDPISRLHIEGNQFVNAELARWAREAGYQLDFYRRTRQQPAPAPADDGKGGK